MVFKLSLNPPLSTHGALKDKDQMQGKRDFFGLFCFFKQWFIDFWGEQYKRQQISTAKYEQKEEKEKNKQIQVQTNMSGSNTVLHIYSQGKGQKKGEYGH